VAGLLDAIDRVATAEVIGVLDVALGRESDRLAPPMRIALLADMHGNLPALLAVAADLARRSIDRVATLGDLLSGPLLPAETAAFLMVQPWTHIAGNQERQLLAFDRVGGGPSDRHARQHVTAAQVGWLQTLPGTLLFHQDVCLCHGSPRSDAEYLVETVEHGRVRLATAAELDERLAGTSSAVVACGHTHLPRVVRAATGQLLVNPGSVGLPAFDDTTPSYHVVETGSPHARYAVLEGASSSWTVELLAVPYEHEAMAELAERNGRPDWAWALRTGCVRPKEG
jgi:predicted phosphodiesterase